MKNEKESFPEQVFPEHVGSFMNDFDCDDQVADHNKTINNQTPGSPPENLLDKNSKSISLNIGAWALARGRRY